LRDILGFLAQIFWVAFNINRGSTMFGGRRKQLPLEAIEMISVALLFNLSSLKVRWIENPRSIVAERSIVAHAAHNIR
jgi:hypothetical protein